MTPTTETAVRLALAASAGLAGALTHEAIHYALAVAVGAERVRLRWVTDGRHVALGKPVVRYSPPSWAAFWIVQLGPQFVGAATLVGYLYTVGIPSLSFGTLYVGMFLLGLTVFGGREDFLPWHAVTGGDA